MPRALALTVAVALAIAPLGCTRFSQMPSLASDSGNSDSGNSDSGNSSDSNLGDGSNSNSETEEGATIGAVVLVVAGLGALRQLCA